MLELGNSDDRIKKLLQRKAKIESDLARAQKAERDKTRRDETRRKIILGGALLAAIQEGKVSDEIGRRLIATFVADRDKKLFDGFVFKLPESVSETPTPSTFSSPNYGNRE